MLTPNTTTTSENGHKQVTLKTIPKTRSNANEKTN